MKTLKLGMVGGGQGALIGSVHRIAARLDGRFELVAGALSSDAERAKISGEELGLAPDRIYTDFKEMAQKEAAREDGIDAVAIVTPNFLHAEPSIAFLKAGIHVICDKPLAASQEQADAMRQAIEGAQARFYLTHNYTGYPLIRLARKMVADGELGNIRLVQVEYAQDWLSLPIEQEGHKQASWRTDPALAGAGALGDIGTHAYNLQRFVTGLDLAEISADVQSFVDGRQVDDNANILVRYESGARGMIWVSQVAAGLENNIRLRIYGDQASLEWSQEAPNTMRFAPIGGPAQILTRGYGESADFIRVPPGHPEGFLEAFASLYQDIASEIHGDTLKAPVPNLQDGLEGMRFIQACLESSRTNGNWVKF